MRIGFVSKGGIESFTPTKKADVVVFGFGEKKEIYYEKEWKGETSFFEEVAKSSKENANVVCHACITNTRGLRCKSAVIAQNGRILGVSDMINAVDKEIGCGSGLRVYDTQAGRIGVVVAEDLYFPDVMKNLAGCGSDFMICPFGKADERVDALLRASAFFYGVPILFCGDGQSRIADADGNLAFSSDKSPVYHDFFYQAEYHLIENRRKGRFVGCT